MPNIKRGMMGAAGVSGVDIGAAGTLWAWGDNGGGQLGNGNKTKYSSPIQIGSQEDWSAISAGKEWMMALRTGTLWTWGEDDADGRGSTGAVCSPVQVGSDTDWESVSAGSTFGAAVKNGGELWAWGNNAAGQLGNGNYTATSTPAQVGSLTDWNKISCGEYHLMAVKDDGTLWGIGSGDTGRLGNGASGTGTNSPIQIGSLTNWLDVSCMKQGTIGLKTDGTLWSWGLNDYGQLGLGDTTERDSPVQVGSLTVWPTQSLVNTGRAFALDDHYSIVQTNGKLWSWGVATFGKLGLGSTTTYSSPVQVGALTTWASGMAGLQAGGGIQTDGTLWMWGNNTNGQLGSSNLTVYSSPVQIGTDEDWQQLEQGATSTYAIRKA